MSAINAICHESLSIMCSGGNRLVPLVLSLPCTYVLQIVYVTGSSKYPDSGLHFISCDYHRLERACGV